MEERDKGGFLFDVLTPLGFHVRVSKTDASVYLFYKTQRKGRWVCAVSKRSKGEGFLVTAYPTDAIKIGEKVWPK